MLVEQIKLKLTDLLPDKKEGEPRKKKSVSDFARNFRILQVETVDPFTQQASLLHIRSAFSERVTRGQIEINACGITKALSITLLCLT